MRILRHFIVDYVMAFIVLIVATYSFYWLMPASFWVSYDKVLVADVSLADGVIEFRSVRHVARVADIGGIDVLFCDLNGDGEFGHFSRGRWEADAVNINDGLAPTAPWAYVERLPPVGIECFIRAVVTLRLPFGIIKQLDPVYSDPFVLEA